MSFYAFLEIFIDTVTAL